VFTCAHVSESSRGSTSSASAIFRRVFGCAARLPASSSAIVARDTPDFAASSTCDRDARSRSSLRCIVFCNPSSLVGLFPHSNANTLHVQYIYETIWESDKDRAPAVLTTPRGPDHREVTPVIKETLPKAERLCRAQARAYEEALARYSHELMDDEERMLLWDRIKHLQRILAS
jgi:hypothetical protein